MVWICLNGLNMSKHKYHEHWFLHIPTFLMSSCFLNVKVCQISVYLVYPVNLTHVPAHPSAQSVSVAESAGTECNEGCEFFLGCKLCKQVPSWAEKMHHLTFDSNASVSCHLVSHRLTVLQANIASAASNALRHCLHFTARVTRVQKGQEHKLDCIMIIFISAADFIRFHQFCRCSCWFKSRSEHPKSIEKPCLGCMARTARTWHV